MNHCKSCTDRQIGCHDKCPAYKTYRAKVDKANANRYAVREVDDYVRTLIVNNRRRGE